MAENKVRFNIKNVHYALLTETVSQGVTSYTYGTPKAIPGAVSIDLSQQGKTSSFYADGIVYYQTEANNGYKGDLNVARLPDSFLKEVLGLVQATTSKILIEKSNANPAEFALLFEVDGNDASECFALYRCTATRPNISGNTVTDVNDPDTQKIEINAIARGDNVVYSRTTHETPAQTKAGWFTAVVAPSTT